MKKKLIALLAALGMLTGCGGEALSTTATAQSLPPVTDTLNVYCFQAGKADAFLFWNDAGAILLDSGEQGFGKTILAKLEELGIQQLDYLIITHFDKDHVGGAKKILNSIPVGTVLQSNSPKEGASAYENYVQALADQGIEPLTLRQSMTLTLGDAVFVVNPPAREVYAQDESNNSSLIVTVLHGAKRLLFCGDAEDLRLAEFLETDPGLCDFVKLPHHGRWQSTLESLLEKTRPACALITSSQEEPEDAETLALLEQAGAACFLTRSAPVLLTSDGRTLSAAYTD